MNEKETSGRRRYETPSIVRFPLKPQEAALGFCKTNNSAGPGQASCRLPTQCPSIGS